jgi:hypothetical protein
VATVESLAGAVVAGIAATKFRPQRLHLLMVMVVLLAGVANILTLIVLKVGGSSNWIMAARLLGGCCNGVLIWVGINMFVRSNSPARLYAIQMTLAIIITLCLATLCSQWLIPRFGGSGAYGCLLGLNVLMIVAALLVPDSFVPIPKSTKKSGLPSGRALASLVSALTFEAAFTSLWAYFLPLSTQLGYPKSVANLAISFCIGFQIVGGLCAAVIGNRLSYRTMLSAAFALALLNVASLSAGVGSVPYLISAAAFGLMWRIAIPYQLVFVIATDPSRRSAMLTQTAQAFGIAIGPFISSLFVSQHSVRATLAVSGCLFTVSLALFISVQIRAAVGRSRLENHASSQPNQSKIIP